MPLRTFWATIAAQMRSASCSAVCFICDVLGRPWSQLPRRLLRGIGRALRHVVLIGFCRGLL